MDIKLFKNKDLNDIYNIIKDSIDGASMSVIVENMEKEGVVFKVQLGLYSLEERGAIKKNERGLYISNLV